MQGTYCVKISRFPVPGIRLQLAAYFLLTFGGLLIAYSVAMYWHVSKTHEHEFDAALNNYVIDVARTLTELGTKQEPTDRSVPKHSDLLLPFSLSDILLRVTDWSDQHIIFLEGGLAERLPAPELPHQKRAYFKNVTLPDTPDSQRRYRMLTHVFQHGTEVKFVIQAAVPTVLLDKQQAGLLIFLETTVPIVLLLATLASLLLSRRALSPVAAIIHKAHAIRAHDLSERIPVPRANDEIRELAMTLNTLLDRLEKAFQAQEHFVADASHQLKTPLSILKGELELFSRQQRTQTELTHFLASAAQEIESLSKMVENLLLLARVDAEEVHHTKTQFRLDEKLMEVVSRYSRLAQEKHIGLSVDLNHGDSASENFSLAGDPELIRAAIENLVDNAIKYSPQKSVVKIVLTESAERFIVQVSDSGPGIPAGSIPFVFDRFYRIQRFSGAPGFGLGLSVVRRVAELHQGKVEARNSTSGGAVMTLELSK